MTKYNLVSELSLTETYAKGWLPQRNDKYKYYQESSCRSNLNNFKLSSENRRILRKISGFTYTRSILDKFNFSIDTKKQIYNWIKNLGWDFPISSVKTIFTSHIFNQLYIWKLNNRVVAYSLCLFAENISHIGYVFYDPEFTHGDLPIGMVLQFIIDSHDQHLDFAYLGRFSNSAGYYKRNLPGFEYFENNIWKKYQGIDK